jgi:hypothetical protein
MNPQVLPYNKGLKEGFQSGVVFGSYLNEYLNQTASFVEPSLSMHTAVYSVTESKPSLKDEDTKIIGSIMNMYEVIHCKEVEFFLKGKVLIRQLVIETYYQLISFFPESDRISLELTIDPENDKKSLVASVFSELSVDDAFNQLDKFDAEWFADQFSISDNIFNVTVELV